MHKLPALLSLSIIALIASNTCIKAIAADSPLYTPLSKEVEQMLDYKSLDGSDKHFKGLPLACKLIGIPQSNNGEALFKEVESRVQAYKQSTKSPDAIAEARFVLKASTDISDEEVKNRLEVIDRVIQNDPLNVTINPHNPSRNVFLLFPH